MAMGQDSPTMWPTWRVSVPSLSPAPGNHSNKQTPQPTQSSVLLEDEVLTSVAPTRPLPKLPALPLIPLKWQLVSYLPAPSSAPPSHSPQGLGRLQASISAMYFPGNVWVSNSPGFSHSPDFPIKQMSGQAAGCWM